MYVVASAGHVDHGKSTLVRLLTGMEPDRWAAEQARGMTIDLGFAWTTLPSGRRVAFVDVPGHERFVPNMLAGVGPVPAVLFVVAADEGWMPQSAEHLAALRALRVRHGLLAITRSDLADPGLAREQALAELAATPLGGLESVAVSGRTGSGLEELRGALDRLVDGLPAPDVSAPVRLWVDRAFTIRGAGTVVTGTLAAGTLSVGDEVRLEPAGLAAVVRGLQALGSPAETVPAVARVAVNLRGVAREQVGRGDVLVSPDRWLLTDVLDARLENEAALPRQLMMHIGSASLPATIRPLGPDTARIRLARPVPLRIGDRALLRDPGRRVIAAGVQVLDVRPPPLRGRGAGPARARELAAPPDADTELRRRGFVQTGQLQAMGLTPTTEPVAADWLVDPPLWQRLRVDLAGLVERYEKAHPLEPGIPFEAAQRALGLPDPRLLTALVEPPLTAATGRIHSGSRDLPGPLSAALTQLRRDLGRAPFHAPESDRLTGLGLGPAELATLVRTGALLAVAPGIYLLPGADAEAVHRLARLPQPFTVSQARQVLQTTRRVAVPLLELLDRQGRTRQLADHQRVVIAASG